MAPNFLVWKFCGKEQFPHSFGRFARTLKISLPSLFTNDSLPWNKRVFVEYIIILKSLSAIGAICSAKLSIFSYRSSDMDK